MSLELFILGVLLLSVILYAVLGGADFGGGIWEFNTALQSSEKEKQLIYRAIGPVWEANHVWLIFVLVLLATAFSPAFEALSRALYLPLLLALAGIVFRGVGFAFRSYAAADVRQQALWGAVFALASTAAPFFLGACVGAIASGQLNVGADGSFAGNYLSGWLSGVSIFTAFFAVAMCAYLAAVYLSRESSELGESELTELWRRRALATGLWVGALAAVGLVLVAVEIPLLWQGFTHRGLPLVAASVMAGAGSLILLWQRKFMWASLAAATAVAAVILGWGAAQWPYLVPPAISVASASSPPEVLTAMLAGILVGSLILIPSLWYLFRLFKQPGAGR